MDKLLINAERVVDKFHTICPRFAIIIEDRAWTQGHNRQLKLPVMAWWTELITKNAGMNRDKESRGETKSFSLNFSRAIKNYLYENFIDVLYFSLSVFTYLYVLLSIVTFVLQDKAAKLLVYGMETLSEPYLGALAIYVLVKQVERHKNPEKAGGRRGELFVIIWLTFLLSATAITFFSDFYELNGIYQTIVTNSLAAIIIRIGSMLR